MKPGPVSNSTNRNDKKAFNYYSLFLCLGSAAEAGVMIGDDAVFGAGSITIDTDTGLEWLDWTESTNRSYNDVSGQFGAGGDFEGWRHATRAVTHFTNKYGNSPSA